MGYDISNHPVDVRLIQGYLIPYIQGYLNDIDLFVKHAVQLAMIARRANRWGLGVVEIDHQISGQLRQLPPQNSPAPADTASGASNFLGRLFGKHTPEPERTHKNPPRLRGIPGFDSDLSVWGRPFFVVGEGYEEALAGFETYLRLPSAADEGVDAVVRSMLARLDRKRADLVPQIRLEEARILDPFYPLQDHVILSAEGADYGADEVEADLRARLEQMRNIYSKRHTDELIPLSDGEEYHASELMGNLPLEIITIAASVLPGWMGRGYVWPTALFGKIGVDVSGLFETPAWLFEPLVRATPESRYDFETTIQQNYTLGGAVRPEKVPALIDLLQKHRRQLITAWSAAEEDEENIEEMSADFEKILEPAIYAARHGFGFIEATEIYSGIGGVMN